VPAVSRSRHGLDAGGGGVLDDATGVKSTRRRLSTAPVRLIELPRVAACVVAGALVEIVGAGGAGTRSSMAGSSRRRPAGDAGRRVDLCHQFCHRGCVVCVQSSHMRQPVGQCDQCIAAPSHRSSTFARRSCRKVLLVIKCRLRRRLASPTLSAYSGWSRKSLFSIGCLLPPINRCATPSVNHFEFQQGAHGACVEASWPKRDGGSWPGGRRRVCQLRFAGGEAHLGGPWR
jgi:hypothetical protein